MKAPEKFVKILDGYLELIKNRRRTLEQMRECIRQNNMSRLRGLLSEEADIAAEMKQMDRKHAEFRRAMTQESGMDELNVTLGAIVETTDPPAALALNDRRERLACAIEQLREEAELTRRLVDFGLDVNNRLMEEILHQTGTVRTYGADAEMRQEPAGLTLHKNA